MQTAVAVDRSAPPPRLSGNPLVGHLGEFMADPIALFLRGYRDLGPIFAIRALHRRYVVMGGPEAMRFLAKSEREHFTMKPVYGPFDELFLSKNSLISSDGEQHAALRKLFRPAMARSALEGRLDAFVDATRRRVRHHAGREVDLLRFCRDLVFHQLATVMEMDALDPSEFYDDIVRAMHTALEVGVTKRWPRVVTYLPAFKRSRARTLDLGRRLAEALKDQGNEDGLFPAIAKAVERKLVEPGDVPMLSLIPLIAGLDTVAASAAFLIAAVHRDPSLVATLRAEVDEANGRGHFLRAELPRIEAVKTESLRRYPVTVASIRHCIEPFEFAGHRVEKGEDVMFAISLPLFLEEHFENPQRFDPERFLGEGAALARGNGFTPFGVGPHACLGTGLAEAQLSAMLATLLLDTELELTNADRPIRVRHDPFPVPVGETVRVRLRGDAR